MTEWIGKFTQFFAMIEIIHLSNWQYRDADFVEVYVR